MHSSSSTSAFDSFSTIDEASWEEDSITTYRERVRPKVPSSYDGTWHLLSLLGASSVGTVLPLVCWVASEGATWKELVTVVPCGLLYANLVEYCIHRFGAHHGGARHSSSVSSRTSRLPAPLRAFRFYHAVVHHSFFHGAGEAMEAEQPSDLYFVLFPSWVYFGWLACGLVPLIAPSAWCWWHLRPEHSEGYGPLARVLLLAAACASFSLWQYEVLHTFHHGALPQPLQACLEHVPVLRLMRRRHRIHHGAGRGKGCFNITWPVGDMLFGTLTTIDPVPNLR